MKQQNRISVFIIIFFIIGIIVMFTTVANCQQGMKASYTTKKVVTEQSLTKDAVIFDTFTETGKHVYYKQRVKKDGTVEDYYFTIVEKKRKDGTTYLTRQKQYVYNYTQK